MKKFVIRYHLEFFTGITLLLALFGWIMYPDISDFRLFLTIFMVLGLLHEWEEKRFPGGFFELMAKKFGLTPDKEKFNVSGTIVIIYWIIIIGVPYIFDRYAFLLMVPAVLGLFEAFIHTIGIFVHKMKKPYTPGLVTAWPMAAMSVYVINYLKTNRLASSGDYVLGAFLMFGTFIIMDICIIRNYGVNPKKMIAQLKHKK